METTINSKMTVIMNTKFMPPDEFKHHCVAILQKAAPLICADLMDGIGIGQVDEG